MARADKSAKAETASDAAAEPKASREGASVQFTPEQFAALIEQLKAGATPGDDGLASALVHIAEASRKSVEEVGRTVRRSNATNLDNRDPFAFDVTCERCQAGEVHKETGSREHPREKLRHKTYFCFNEQRADSLTPTEISLINQFDVDKESRNGQWTALFRQSGTKRELHIMVPFEHFDQRIDLPPLVQILSELLFGQTVADPSQSAAIIADLQRRLAAVEANGAGQAAP